jgi:hypothetical protein
LPHAATAPFHFVCAQALASVWLPTVSTTPGQRSLCSGLPADASSARSIVRAAPSERR